MNYRGSKRIGHQAFQAIAYLNTKLAIMFRNQQYQAIVFTFLAYAPMTAEHIAVLCNCFRTQIINSGHYHLIACLGFVSLEGCRKLPLD